MSWPGGTGGSRVKAKGTTIPMAVARLVLKLEALGQQEEAAKLRASAEAALGASFIDVLLAPKDSATPQGVLKPLGEVVESLIETRHKAGKLSGGTYPRYRGLLRNHIMPSALAKMPMDAISPKDIERFLDQLRAKKGKDGTLLLGTTPLTTIEGLLAQAFHKQLVEGKLVIDPMASIERTKKLSKAVGAQFAAREGAARFITLLMQEIPYKAYLTSFLLGFGLRTSERLAIRHCSIATALRHGKNRLPQPVITVDRQLAEDLSLQPLKNNSEPRRLPLPMVSAPHLDALYLRRAIHLVKLAEQAGTIGELRRKMEAHAQRWDRPNMGPSGAMFSPLFEQSTYLYASSKGGPLRRQNVNAAWKRLLEKYGDGEQVREHDLRHVCATELGRRNFPAVVISAITGHAVDRRNTLQAVYTHPSAGQKKEAMEFLGAIFGRPAEPPQEPLPDALADYAGMAPLWSLWRADRETDYALPRDATPHARAVHAMNQLWMPEAFRVEHLNEPINLASIWPLNQSSVEWHQKQGIDALNYFPRGK